MTWNEEEATAIGEEVAEIPVEDEHHARDANTRFFFYKNQYFSSQPQTDSYFIKISAS